MEGAEWVAFANWPACLKYCWSPPNLMADWFCADLSYHASNPDPSGSQTRHPVCRAPKVDGNGRDVKKYPVMSDGGGTHL